ncbi:hypothetical protein C8Q80DRAFT_1319708 [Daedaleopsis nitida]|nr:hypothetical protein C8Q80DRAFT_1319708 [Daedaleopsis nitida]
MPADRTTRNKPGRKTTAPAAWVCPECNTAITHKTDIKRHQASHLPPTHFCPHAGCPGSIKGFRQRSNLMTHLNSVHDKLKTYECNKCEKSYYDPASLHRHRQVAHGSQKQKRQQQKEQNNRLVLTLPSVVDAPVAGPSFWQDVKEEQIDFGLLQSFPSVAGPSGSHAAPSYILKPEDVEHVLNEAAFHCGTFDDSAYGAFGDYQVTDFPSLPAPAYSEAALLAGMEQWMNAQGYVHAPSSYNTLSFTDAQPQQPHLQPQPVPVPVPAPVHYPQPRDGTVDPSALLLLQTVPGASCTYEQQTLLTAGMGAGVAPYMPSREASTSPFGNGSVAGGEGMPALRPGDLLQEFYLYRQYPGCL